MPELDLAGQLVAYVDVTTEPVPVARVTDDAVIDLDTPPAERHWRRWPLIAAAAFVAVVVGLAVAVLDSDDNPPTITENPSPTAPPPPTSTPEPDAEPTTEEAKVPAVDVSESVERFDIGEIADRLAAGPDTMWVLPPGGAAARTSLIPVDATTGEVLQRIELPAYEDAVYAGRWLWVRVGPAEDGQAGLWRIDPVTGAASRQVPDDTPWPFAGTDEVLWAERHVIVDGSGANDRLFVERRHPDTGALVASIEIPTESFDPQDVDVFLAANDDAVWVLTSSEPVVHRVDPATNDIAATIDLSDDGTFSGWDGTLIADGDDVWLVGADFIGRIDGETNTVDPRTIETPEGVSAVQDPPGAEVEAVLVGDKILLAAPTGFYRIDTTTMTHDAVLDLGTDPAYPSSFVATDDSVWFTAHTGPFGEQLPWVGRLPLGDAVEAATTADRQAFEWPAPIDVTPASLPPVGEPLDVSIIQAEAQFSEELVASPDGFWARVRDNDGLDRLVRLDPATESIVATIETDFVWHGLFAGTDSVWVHGSNNVLHRIDPANNSTTTTFDLSRIDRYGDDASRPSGDVGPDAVWVVNDTQWDWLESGQGDWSTPEILRIGLDPLLLQGVIALPDEPAHPVLSIDAGPDAVWVGTWSRGGIPGPGVALHRLSPDRNGLAATIHLPTADQLEFAEVVVGESDVWVVTGSAQPTDGADAADRFATIFRVDPSTNTVESAIAIPLEERGSVAGAVSDGRRLFVVTQGHNFSPSLSESTLTVHTIDGATDVVDRVDELTDPQAGNISDVVADPSGFVMYRRDLSAHMESRDTSFGVFRLPAAG